MALAKFQRSMHLDTILNALGDLIRLPALSYGESAEDNRRLGAAIRELEAVILKEAENTQGVLDPYLIPFVLVRSKISPVLRTKFESSYEEVLIRDHRPNKYALAFEKLRVMLHRHQANLHYDEHRDIMGSPARKRSEELLSRRRRGGSRNQTRWWTA